MLEAMTGTTSYKKRCVDGRAWLSFLILFFFCCSLHARILTDGHFVRLASPQERNAQGFFLIASECNGITYLLTNKSFNHKNKLQARVVSEEDNLWFFSDLSCIWKLEDAGDGRFCLVSAENGETVSAAPQVTDVQMGNRSDGNQSLHFDISFKESLFRLGVEDKNDRERYLSFYGTDYFGLYLDDYGINVTLYQYSCDTVDSPTLSDFPPAPAAFVLDGEVLRTDAPSGLYLQDVSAYLLSDGTLASEAPAGIFTGHDGKVDFPIPGEMAGGQWKCYGNTPLYVKDSTLYAPCRKCGERTDITLRPTDSINGLTIRYFSLVTAAAPGSQEVSSCGTMALSGGWSRRGLESLPIDSNVLALDLTSAVLPSEMPLLSYDSQPNLCVYIKEEDSTKVDSRQQNLIVCGEAGNRLLRSFKLRDCYPFYFDRPFEVSSGAMTYERPSSDGGWQTLYLPFDVGQYPADITVEVFDRMDGGNAMFKNATEIKAYTPVLFKKESGTLVFSCQGGTIGKTPDGTGLFCGATQKTCYVDMYALSGTGSTFVRCLSGSYISPFRCFLRTAADKEIRLLNGMGTVRADRTVSRCFDLLGRATNETPSGMYIQTRKIKSQRK